MKRCSECREEALVGSRCLKHFTRRYARRENLLNSLWYISHEDEFLAKLTARYFAIQHGFDTPPEELLTRIFRNGRYHVDLRHFGAERPINRVRKIIAACDRRAKESKHADHSGSNKDREQVGGSTAPERKP